VGHKVHPHGFRLGVIHTWQARWYLDKGYRTTLHEDFALRGLIAKRHANASISQVDIERAASRVTVTIHTAKPGIIIGRSGANVEELRKELEAVTGKKVAVNILEVRQPDLSAVLVARNIADQLEKRVAFKRAMKLTMQRTMQAGAKGARVLVAGRLGGSEMARREQERRGRVPLQTLRADIDFGQAEALTTYGKIGIKVWIYKGDVLPGKMAESTDTAPSAPRSDGGQRRDRGGPRRDRGPRPAAAGGAR
jgi:small subunit ribosomal protein S3